MTPPPGAARHVRALVEALAHLDGQLADLDRLGTEIGTVLGRGGRLLAVGNGGSAAHAQHLTAELVGRFRADRPALSAFALTVDSSTVTALANDYGADALFARQVEAHGRAGDVLVALSTSGSSPNVLAAATAAHRLGMVVVALTGPAPNPLASLADRPVAVTADNTATIQEVHQVIIHLLCDAVDRLWSTGDRDGVVAEAGAR
jgi:D-sedoheptulose 7-phosphate isomerase